MATAKQTPTKPRRRSTRPTTLNRPELLATALELIEQYGVEDLSMRKLAAACDVEAMSLYNHVTNKDDVLDGVTGLFFERLQLPEPTDDWAHDIRAIGDALRTLARAYPKTATLALTREAVSDAGVSATAAALAIFARAGFNVEESVRVLRTTMAFLVGFLLRELTSAPTPGTATDEDQAARAALIASSPHPVIVNAAEPLAALDFDDEYEFGVQLLLTAISDHATRTPPTSPPD